MNNLSISTQIHLIIKQLGETEIESQCYLSHAIEMVCRYPEYLKNINVLYQGVADHYCSSVSEVKQKIETSISNIYDNHYIQLYTFSIGVFKERPTVEAFLFVLATVIRSFQDMPHSQTENTII